MGFVQGWADCSVSGLERGWGVCNEHMGSWRWWGTVRRAMLVQTSQGCVWRVCVCVCERARALARLGVY